MLQICWPETSIYHSLSTVHVYVCTAKRGGCCTRATAANRGQLQSQQEEK